MSGFAVALRATLSLLPCMFFFLLSASSPALSSETTHPLSRFEDSVKAFEAKDAVAMPAAGGTVFVGSSTFAHWTTMEQELKDLSAINRGFGGSTMPEVNYYFERIVAKYHPSRIVLYAGTNDIADGRSGEQVAHDVASFIAEAHREMPNCQVYYISMSMAPSRVQWSKQYVIGNRLVSAMAAHDPEFHYIDVLPVMYDERGVLHKDYFGPDNLHMNKTGYAAWVPVIRQALAAPCATGSK